MKKYLLIVFSIFSLQNMPAQNDTVQDPCTSKILVVAHRGAHNEFPENSISSVKEAIVLGVDMVEIDVRTTKDSVLVLMHDVKIDRTTDGKGLVEDYTLSELQLFKLKKSDGTIVEESIPTLEEVLNSAKGLILFDLDIKSADLLSVVEMVEKTNTSASCYFLLDDLEKASLLRARNNQLKMLFAPKDEASIRIIMETIYPDAIHLNDKINTVDVNNLVRGYGSKTFMNTLWNLDKVAVKNPDLFQQIYQNGANMIQTDYPELLLKHLRINNLHK